jgi:hypothetical protein
VSELQFWINISVLIVTIVAVIYGPIKAVKIAREIEDRHSDRERKYLILSDLMRTRRARLDGVHIGALNLIELEFYKNEKVVHAYRSYARHLSTPFPQVEAEADAFVQQRDDLFTDLLFEVANALDYHFDKRDISRLGYFPEGVLRYQDSTNANAHLLREVLEGRRAIPISNLVSDPTLFPPPPEKVRDDKA